MFSRAALVHGGRRGGDFLPRGARHPAASVRVLPQGRCAGGRPGEFTLRAFLNGRIDLTQAEAVRDLIDSQTLYQARVAAQQLEGSVSARLKPRQKGAA